MKQDLNISTGKITKSDFTEEEIIANQKQAEINRINYEKTLANETAKASEKAALLAKLGITEDEAKLLLS